MAFVFFLPAISRTPSEAQDLSVLVIARKLSLFCEFSAFGATSTLWGAEGTIPVDGESQLTFTLLMPLHNARGKSAVTEAQA